MIHIALFFKIHTLKYMFF